MSDLVGIYTNRMEDHPAELHRKMISAAVAPTDAARRTLEARRAELRDSLRATPGDAADDVLYAIMATGNTYGASGDEIDVKVRLYAEAVRDQPTWALEQARINFSKPGWKSSWDGKGIPACADVVSECRAVVQHIEAELYRIGQILDAEIVDNTTTPEQREEALARWAILKASIGGGKFLHERTPDEIARERSELQRANAVVKAKEATAHADRLRAQSDLSEAKARAEAQSQTREDVA